MVTDQTRVEKKSGHDKNIGDLLCPNMCISPRGIQIPSSLDSSSEVTLLWKLYFNKHILPKIKLAKGEKADAHTLFRLTVANDGQMPIKMYTELDFTFWGSKYQM